MHDYYTNTSLPKGRAILGAGDNTCSIGYDWFHRSWAFSMGILRSWLSQGWMDPNFVQIENTELHPFRVWMERGRWLKSLFIYFFVQTL